MGILRHKNDKPAKAKRTGKKLGAPRSGKTSGKAKNSSVTMAAKAQTRATRRKQESGAEQIEPPKLNLDSGQDRAPTQPLSATDSALLRTVKSGPGEQRRRPERSGPATTHSDAKRAGSDSRSESGESGNSPPRPNKLVPTNAVHPTERRIKRRFHKNGALVATAGAALLGVLILNNQSEPPALILGDQQVASRLPAAQDWQNNATPDAVSEVAADIRVPVRTPDSDSPRVTAPTPPEQELAARTQLPVGTGKLSRGDIVEMEHMLGRMDLTASAPDGVVDENTAQAIRLYQEIAGLPVDGEASQDLLNDMREVMKILDGNS